MDISFVDEGKVRVASLSGRMDAVTAPDFEKAASQWIEDEKKDFVLDLSELEYISSAGLRAILAITKRISPSEGRLVLCGLQGVVEEVFTISGFDSFLPIREDRKSALAEF